MNKYERARHWYLDADKKRWLVAQIAYKTPNRLDKIKLADAIRRKETTVDNLYCAYSLFVELMKNAKDTREIRNMRRELPYTRWNVVYRSWNTHEFSLEEAKDWLNNFDGGNDALGLELENKYGAPEYERRAASMYRDASKLVNDFGVPDKLQKAAQNYVNEYDLVYPKIVKVKK